MLPALLGAVGGMLDIFGQTQARRDQKDMAYHSMAFQRDMSNTSYQRAVSDMKSAGLNPMLAYSQGGAGTPGGAAISPQPTEYGKGITSALQAKQLSAATENIEAQADLNRAQAVKAAADTRATLASASQTERTVDSVVRRYMAEADTSEFERNWRRELDDYRSPRLRNELNAWKLRANQLDESDWRLDAMRGPDGTIESERRQMAADRELAELLLPGARNEAEVDRSDYGKDRPYIRDAGAIASGASSAAGAAVLLRNLFRKPVVRGGYRQGPAHRGSWDKEPRKFDREAYYERMRRDAVDEGRRLGLE